MVVSWGSLDEGEDDDHHQHQRYQEVVQHFVFTGVYLRHEGEVRRDWTICQDCADYTIGLLFD